MDRKEYKVMLKGPEGIVVFDASVPVTESRSASWDKYPIVQLPTDILAYRNTSARRWSINGKLVSRTIDEANTNNFYVDLIRGWSLPDFGDSGATPPVLKFYAFENKNINGVQVVILSYSWQYGEDVDFIWESKDPIPVIGLMSLEVEEIYSAAQITNKAWKMKRGNPGSNYSASGISGTDGDSGSSTSNSTLVTTDFNNVPADGISDSVSYQPDITTTDTKEQTTPVTPATTQQVSTVLPPNPYQANKQAYDYVPQNSKSVYDYTPPNSKMVYDADTGEAIPPPDSNPYGKA